jgi:hypothetical protein
MTSGIVAPWLLNMQRLQAASQLSFKFLDSMPAGLPVRLSSRRLGKASALDQYNRLCTEVTFDPPVQAAAENSMEMGQPVTVKRWPGGGCSSYGLLEPMKNSEEEV